MKIFQRSLLLVVALCGILHAQRFAVVERHQISWKCRGMIWVEDSHLYCKDALTHDLAKLAFDGREIFTRLENPSVGSAQQVVGLATDLAGEIYVVDGMHIHIYSNDGKFKKSITPGIQLTLGIAVLDPEHIFVSGHTDWRRNGTSASIFDVSSAGIRGSFGQPFFTDRTGLEGFVLNTPGLLALDRTRKLLYQTSPNFYQVRVFDLQGKQMRTISPPAEYMNRPPNVVHSNGGVGIGPGDTLDDVAVLPDGGFAVIGARYDGGPIAGAQDQDSYTRFLDVYDAYGRFVRRLSGNDLQLEGKHLWGIDHRTGRAFFSKGADAIEAEVRH